MTCRQSPAAVRFQRRSSVESSEWNLTSLPASSYPPELILATAVAEVHLRPFYDDPPDSTVVEKSTVVENSRGGPPFHQTTARGAPSSSHLTPPAVCASSGAASRPTYNITFDFRSRIANANG